MEKIIIIAVILLSSGQLFAQTDSTKIEQYCRVIVSPRLFSEKVTIELDLGEEKSIWHDERLRTMEGRLRKFNTVVDAMNYMGKEGWKFLNAYPVRMGNSERYHLAFMKEISKAALLEN